MTRLSGRDIVHAGLAFGGLFALGRLAHAREQQARSLTPPMIMGPFYPLKPLDRDADLTRIRGSPGRAQGEILHVVGRVVNRSGEPVRGAETEPGSLVATWEVVLARG